MRPGIRYRRKAFLGKGSARETMTITAKYEDGVFKPLEDVAVNDGTIVEVRVPSYADRLKGEIPVRPGLCVFRHVEGSRTDIGDSVEYISNLRRDTSGLNAFPTKTQ
jgi:hypothetical protein